MVDEEMVDDDEALANEDNGAFALAMAFFFTWAALVVDEE
jgi:hypothetical protein